MLFALCLNDFENAFILHECKGVESVDPVSGGTIITLFVMLYANHSIIMSTNQKDFRNALNTDSKYCTDWKLNINANKSKIIVFGQDKRSYKFTINNISIEKV